MGKNFLSSLLISLLTALTICLPSLNQYLNIMQKTEQGTEDGFIYYDLQHEDNPINKNITDFKNIYDSLLGAQNKEYQYYEIYTQYLENYDKDKSYCDELSGELVKGHKFVNSIQVGRNVISKNNIKLSKGRMFNKEDFLLSENKVIPVIMGDSYSSVYEVSDIIKLNYLFDTYHFEIIGFFMEGARIEFSAKNILLDGYIVMPSFNIDADTETTDGLKIHYANKTSGIVQIKENSATIFHKDIEPLLSDKNVGTYSWTISPMNHQIKEMFGMGIKGIKICIWVITFFLVVTNIFLIHRLVSNVTEKIPKKHKLIRVLFIILMADIFYCLINYLYMLLGGIFLFRIFHFILMFLEICMIFYCVQLFNRKSLGGSI